jgi:hypothetical protein
MHIPAPSIRIIHMQRNEVVPEFLGNADDTLGIDIIKVSDNTLPMKQIEISDDNLKKIVARLCCFGHVILL